MLKGIAQPATESGWYPQVIPCEQGRVDLARVFGRDARALVAHLNVEGQHRGAVAAARAVQEMQTPEHKEGGHAHDHGPAAGTDGPGTGHSNEHSHNHAHTHGKVNGHDHHRAHDAGDAKRAKVAEEQHAHEHKCAEDHVHNESCGHGHGHEHDHGHSHAAADRQETTAAKQYGIRSFVYSRRRPFHSRRCVGPAAMSLRVTLPLPTKVSLHLPVRSSAPGGYPSVAICEDARIHRSVQTMPHLCREPLRCGSLAHAG